MTAATWAGVAYTVLVALVLAFVLYNRAVMAIGSSRTAIYNCVTPLVAMVIAWLLLGEVPTGLQYVGVGLVIAGVAVSMRR